MTEPTEARGPIDPKLAMDRANVLTQTRNQILTEGFNGLTLINAGGAAALGAFLQAVWDKPSAAPMLSSILWGICWLLFGTAVAASGFVARHLSFFHRNTLDPFKNPWWWAELGIIALAVIFFLVGMGVAVSGAFLTVHCACRT